MRLLLDLYSGEYSQAPSHAAFDLTPELIARVRELQAVLKGCKADCISEFNYSLEFVDEDGKEDEEFRTDCEQLKVGTDYFLWKGLEKHTDDHYATQAIYNSTLNLLTCPKKELAKHLTSDDALTRQLAEGRLKGALNAKDLSQEHSCTGSSV